VVIGREFTWNSLASPLPSLIGDQPWRAYPLLKIVHDPFWRKTLLVMDEWVHSPLIRLSILRTALLLSVDRRLLPALLAPPTPLNEHCLTPR
jgi:hypothetical protein